MSSYTTTAAAVNWPAEVNEFSYGRQAAKAGNVRQNGHGYLVRCADAIERLAWGGDWRPASPNEAEGIEKQISRTAEALAEFCGYDELEAMAYAQPEELDLDECSCVLPEHSCTACRRAAQYEHMSSQRMFGFALA